jgi:hypothetical protein
MSRSNWRGDKYPGSGGARYNPGWGFSEDLSYAEQLARDGYRSRTAAEKLEEDKARAARKQVEDQERIESLPVSNATAALMQRLYNSSFRVSAADEEAIRHQLKNAITYFRDAIPRCGDPSRADTHRMRIAQCERALRELTTRG